MIQHKKGIYEKFIKRPLDFILSLVSLIVLSPLLITISILVRINLGSPVIFKQERPGRNEKFFTMYKYRTMTDDKDEHGNLLPDSVRLTKFGKFLRSTSIDELPELWNIIKGDMSFIGPRPLLVRYLPYYFDHERLRSDVRPGITGLAQVNGRNALTWDERFATDVEYVNKLTFLNDIKIIVKTVLVVFMKRDILVGNEHVLLDLDVERSGVVLNGEK